MDKILSTIKILKTIKTLRIIMLLLIIMIFSSIVSGCFDSREVDDLGYVIAMGFDRGKTNKLKMTLQFVIPQGASGSGAPQGKEGKSAGISSSTTITAVETPTLYSGLNMVNNYISKQVNLSHVKVLVFSKELAMSEDMHLYMHAITRGREFRPTAYIVVSRGPAEEYIRNVVPILQVNPSKYYELNYAAYKYTGFTADTTFHNFYTQVESLTGQAVATLAGVSGYKTSDDFTLEGSTYKEKGKTSPSEGDYKAGGIPETSDIKTEIMGLAVFDGEKMVGELDGEETMDYLMVTGKYGYSYISVRDPKKKEDNVVLNLKQSRRPSYKVEIIDGKPMIHVEIKLEADFLSIQSGINYENTGNTPIIEKAAEKQVKEGIIRYLDKTAKEFHSDINGFGNHIRQNFLTWDRLVKFNWLGRYKYSTFDVNVDVKIRRPGLIIRSLPFRSSEGAEKH